MSGRARAAPWWRDERFERVGFDVQWLLVFELRVMRNVDCDPNYLLTEGLFRTHAARMTPPKAFYNSGGLWEPVS